MITRGKSILIVLSVLIIGIGTYFYVGFFGIPWKKVSVGKEILHYLEDKYDESFVIEERFYNFKDGTYNIKVHPERDPSLVFIAGEGYGSDSFLDYYPEEVWQGQAYEDFEGIVNRIYPEKKRFSTSAVYGEGIELVKGPNIPHYKESGSLISIYINLPRKMEESEEEFLKMLRLTEIVKEKGGKVEIFYAFEENGADSKDTTYALFSPDEVQKIKTIKDVEKYYNSMQ